MLARNPALGEDTYSYGTHLADPEDGSSGRMTEGAKPRPTGDAGSRDGRFEIDCCDGAVQTSPRGDTQSRGRARRDPGLRSLRVFKAYAIFNRRCYTGCYAVCSSPRNTASLKYNIGLRSVELYCVAARVTRRRRSIT